MILDTDGNKLTPLKAAKRLFYVYGAQNEASGIDEGAIELQVEKLTERDEQLIRVQLEKVTKRMWKLLYT